MTDDATSPPVDADAGGTDPGVAFNQAAVPDVPAELPTDLKKVDVARVKEILLSGSMYAHGAIGEAVHAELTMRDWEADMLAPGIARYINSRATLLAAVNAGGDEYLQLVVGSLFYGGRIWMERMAYLRQAAEQDTAPDDGVDPKLGAREITRVNGDPFQEA